MYPCYVCVYFNNTYEECDNAYCTVNCKYDVLYNMRRRRGGKYR